MMDDCWLTKEQLIERRKKQKEATLKKRQIKKEKLRKERKEKKEKEGEIEISDPDKLYSTKYFLLYWKEGNNMKLGAYTRKHGMDTRPQERLEKMREKILPDAVYFLEGERFNPPHREKPPYCYFLFDKDMINYYASIQFSSAYFTYQTSKYHYH